MDETQKSRIAIGIFNELANLRRVLSELGALCSDLGHVVLLADVGALSGQLEAEFAPGRTNGRLEAPRLIIRKNTSFSNVKGLENSPSEDASLAVDHWVHFDRWIAPRLSKDLNRHLADGACMLIAPISKVDDDLRVTKILLNHAAGSVQLHEFSLPT